MSSKISTGCAQPLISLLPREIHANPSALASTTRPTVQTLVAGQQIVDPCLRQSVGASGGKGSEGIAGHLVERRGIRIVDGESEETARAHDLVDVEIAGTGQLTGGKRCGLPQGPIEQQHRQAILPVGGPQRLGREAAFEQLDEEPLPPRAERPTEILQKVVELSEARIRAPRSSQPPGPTS